ncbi:MAG: hypothetical protein ACLUFF_04745 [Acutalibacteraceae bacterium]
MRAPYKQTDVIDLYLIGVKPQCQKQGHVALILNDLTKEAIANHGKYARNRAGWRQTKNPGALESYDAVQHKRRRCWIKILKTEKWPGRDARSFCAKNHSPGERKKDDVDDEKRKTVAMK